jgi:hypothetical protein
MMRFTKFMLILFLVVLAGTAFPGIALAKGLQDDKVVTGGSFSLENGQTLDGNLLILGGTASLMQGSRVNGNVVMFGGSLSIDGEVDGSVLSIGGPTSLGETAVVNGDLSIMAAPLSRAAGARVTGQVITGIEKPFTFLVPGTITVPEVPNLSLNFTPLWSGIWFFFKTFMWAALAVLVVMFLPKTTQHTADAVVLQPVIMGGVGLLTVVVAPLLFLGIAITIILIPISLLGLLALALAWLYGRVAIGLEVGRRLETMFKQDWPLAVSAGIGTFVLAFVVDGAAQLISCVGWIFPALVGIVGLGAVLMTRFGTQPYSPAIVPSYPPGSQSVEPARVAPTDLAKPRAESSEVTQEGESAPQPPPEEG